MSYRFWTEDEVEHVRANWFAPENDLTIAKTLGRSILSIKDKRSKLRLVKGPKWSKSGKSRFRRPNLATYIAAASTVAAGGRVTVADILSARRDSAIVRARFQVWKALYDDARGYSLSGIAEIAGKHHTTILYGLRTLGGYNRCHPALVQPCGQIVHGLTAAPAGE